MKINIENATADLDYKPDWKKLSASQKIRYIWDYYKLPIAIALAVIFFIIYILFRFVTRTNEILFVGTLNLSVSDELSEYLTDGYVDDPAYGSRDRVSLSDIGSYTEDESSPNYAASTMTRIKLMAYVAADQLDIVLMDQEAFDALAGEGYLMDLNELSELVSDENRAYLDSIASHFIDNTVYISEENGSEPSQVESGSAANAGSASASDATPAAGTETVSIPVTRSLAFDLSESDFPFAGDFSEPVYIGVIGSTGRADEAVSYLRYILGARF